MQKRKISWWWAVGSGLAGCNTDQLADAFIGGAERSGHTVNKVFPGDKGSIDPAKLNALLFDTFQSGYYTVGEQVGQAWSSGSGLMEQP